MMLCASESTDKSESFGAVRINADTGPEGTNPRVRWGKLGNSGFILVLNRSGKSS